LVLLKKETVMKKLVALILVLGMSSLASAELIFTVNGEPQPDSITIDTSQTIELDLEIMDGHNVTGYTLDYKLSNNQAELLIDNLVFEAAFELPSFGSGGGQAAQITGSQLFGNPIEGPISIMQGMILHCLERTDVVLTISTPAGGTVVDGATLEPGVLHTLRIVQDIPEPMTVALLGLGGLFLLRRRK
jgi:hypothetical protein